MADHRIMQQEKPLFVLLFKNKIQTTKNKTKTEENPVILYILQKERKHEEPP